MAEAIVDVKALQESVASLQETLHRIYRVKKRDLILTVPNNGTVRICDSEGNYIADGHKPVAAALADLLRVPDPPKTITITVPFEWARLRGLWCDNPKMAFDSDQKVAEACRDAIKPYAQQ